MAKISADYLLRLLDDETKDNEILRGYMKYYIAQGRNIGDMKHDYMRLRTDGRTGKDMRTFIFTIYEPKQIDDALVKVRQILDSYLLSNFDCKTTDDIEM